MFHRLWIFTCLYLVGNSNGFCQDYSGTIGVNFNRIHTNEYFTKVHAGASSVVSCRWYLPDSIPLRVSIAQENYTSSLSSSEEQVCEGDSWSHTARVSNISLVIYPLSYRIKSVIELNLGVQFSRVIRNNIEGCWYRNNDLIDISTQNPSENYNRGVIGFNARIAGRIELKYGWSIIPEISIFTTPMQEFRTAVGGSTLRRFVGIGLSHKVSYK